MCTVPMELQARERGAGSFLAQLINKVLFAPAAALSDKRELEFLDV